MNLIVEAGIMNEKLFGDLIKKADRILSITAASIKTIRSRKDKKSQQSKIRNQSNPFLSRSMNSNGSTEYAARSSRRNTIRLIGGTAISRQPFSSASTASRYAGSEA